MNYSHQQNNSLINNNNNNSLVKNRSSSNSYLDKFKSNIKSNMSLQPNNSLVKPHISDRMNLFSNQNQPITPNYPPTHNMTPLSFSLSNGESGFTFSENIHVFLRVRPFSNLELSRGDTKCIDLANQQMVFFNNKAISKNFSFDYVFGENSSQEEVFQNSQMNVIILLLLL